MRRTLQTTARAILVSLVVGALALSTGCGESEADQQQTTDAGATDGSPPDGGTPDGGAQPCATAAQCPDLQLCAEGVCQPGRACHDSAACGQAEACDPLRGRCVPQECRSPADCADARTCRDGLCFGPARACAAVVELPVGTPVEGSLLQGGANSQSICAETAAQREAIFHFALAAPRDVLLEVRSGDWSPVLYLRQRCGEDVASDDIGCSATTPEARQGLLMVPGLAAGDYFLYVDTASVELRDHSFTVQLTTQEGPAVVGGDCAAPAELPLTDERGSLQLLDVVEATAPRSTSCGGENAPQVYRLTLTRPAQLEVKLQATVPLLGATVTRDRCFLTDRTDWLACVARDETLRLPHAAAGEYWIGVGGAPGGYLLTVTVRDELPAPANDTCAAAEAVELTPGPATALHPQLLGAADDLGVSPCDLSQAGDVFYRLALPQPAPGQAWRLTATPDTVAAPSLTLLAACDAEQALGCAGREPALVVEGLGAGEYLLEVDGEEAGTVTLALEAMELPAPTPGEACDSAGELALVDGQAEAAGDLGPAQRDLADETCNWTPVGGGGGNGPDQLWHFTLAQESQVTVTILQGGNAAPLGITAHLRPGVCGPAPQSQACVDEYQGGRLVARLPAGDVFLAVRAAYDPQFEGQWPASFPYRVLVEVTDPPPVPDNDGCAGASELALDPAQGEQRLVADLAAAGDDAGGSCGGEEGGDVVYRLVLDAPAHLTVSERSGVGFVTYLRRACDHAAAADELGCAVLWPGQSQLYRNLAAGEYFLWVDMYERVETVEVGVRVQPVRPARPGDSCESPLELPIGGPEGGVWREQGDLSQEQADLADSWCGIPGTGDRGYRLTLQQPARVRLRGQGNAGLYVMLRTQCELPPDEDFSYLPCWTFWGEGEATVPSLPAGTYFIVLRPNDPSVLDASYWLEVEVTPSVLQPTNDRCADALELPLRGGEASVLGSLLGADDDRELPDCSVPGGGEVYYRLTLPGRARVEYTLRAYEIAASVALFDSCDAEARALDCNGVGGPQQLDAGDYYLVVDASNPFGAGDFRLQVNVVPLLGAGSACRPARNECDAGLYCDTLGAADGHGVCRSLGFGEDRVLVLGLTPEDQLPALLQLKLATGEVEGQLPLPEDFSLSPGSACGVAVDGDGRIYVESAGLGLWRLDPALGEAAAWERPALVLEDWFSASLRALALAADGRLLLANNERVRFWEPDGEEFEDVVLPSELVGGLEQVGETLVYPTPGRQTAWELAVISLQGEAQQQWPLSGVNEPSGLARSGGKLLLSESWEPRIHVFDVATQASVASLRTPLMTTCGLALVSPAAAE